MKKGSNFLQHQSIVHQCHFKKHRSLAPQCEDFTAIERILIKETGIEKNRQQAKITIIANLPNILQGAIQSGPWGLEN